MRTVFYVFFVGLVQSLFKLNSKCSLAFKKLIGTSFLIQETHRYQYKTILSRIKDFLNSPILAKNIAIKSNYIVYDVNDYSKQNRLDYLKNYNVIYSNLQFISAESLLGFKTNWHKILMILSIIPIVLVQLLLGLFIKDKSGISSVLQNILITSNFLNILDSKSVSKLFIFSIYDTNSAFLSLSLMRNGFNVVNISSEVPLYKWNKIVICNTLHVCSSYQLAELNHIPTLIYDKVKLGMPEKSYMVKDLYVNEPSPINNQLGFISTGGWVRNKLGHVDQGTNIESNEAQILLDLNEILHNCNSIKLIIYPHPRELTYYSNIEDLTQHYKQFLPNINFEIKQKGTPNNELFDETQLAICYLSTIIFERAYFKRKSAIVYFKDDIFPVDFKDDYLAIINSREELNQLIFNTYQAI